MRADEGVDGDYICDSDDDWEVEGCLNECAVQVVLNRDNDDDWVDDSSAGRNNSVIRVRRATKVIIDAVVIGGRCRLGGFSASDVGNVTKQ